MDISAISSSPIQNKRYQYATPINLGSNKAGGNAGYNLSQNNGSIFSSKSSEDAYVKYTGSDTLGADESITIGDVIDAAGNAAKGVFNKFKNAFSGVTNPIQNPKTEEEKFVYKKNVKEDGSYEVQKYNKDGSCLEISKYDKDGNIKRKSTFEGNETSSATYDSNHAIKTLNKEKTYDRFERAKMASGMFDELTKEEEAKTQNFFMTNA